jgi:hypothetical protein
VNKVVFDVSTHMRGAAGSALFATAGVGGIVGTAIARGHVHNYWLYVSYKRKQEDEQALLEVSQSDSKNVVDKASAIFGSKVIVAVYPEQGEQVDPEKLSDIKEKDFLTIDKKDHPLPEVKADKALIVVVCQPLAARFAGRGSQFKLHANDQVIAVNRQGTYSFAYLDPGKYRLVSQSENAYGFEMELEAGKSYYFVQNIFQGVLKEETSLTRNSPELVMSLLDGSYHSDWHRK